jgi:hypothetical protein
MGEMPVAAATTDIVPAASPATTAPRHVLGTAVRLPRLRMWRRASVHRSHADRCRRSLIVGLSRRRPANLPPHAREHAIDKKHERVSKFLVQQPQDGLLEWFSKHRLNAGARGSSD